MHFSATLPAGMPMPVVLTDVVSVFGDAASAPQRVSAWGSTTLSPSLVCDLSRFEGEVFDSDPLPVLAATARHMTPLHMQLSHQARIVELSVFPHEQCFHADLDMCALPADATSRLRLVHVAAAPVRAPADPERRTSHMGTLAQLLWRFSLYGARDELLPEIAGPARYRLAAGVPLRSLPMDERSRAALRRLRGEPVTLDEWAASAALERSSARRLLNAVYLQGRLMVTRSLPMQRRPSRTRRSTR